MKIYKHKELIKARKGWARTGGSEPCGVPTLGKYH